MWQLHREEGLHNAHNEVIVVINDQSQMQNVYRIIINKYFKKKIKNENTKKKTDESLQTHGHSMVYL